MKKFLLLFICLMVLFCFLRKFVYLCKRDIFYFSNISFNIDFAFFFLLSQKKEEKCSQKEERKTVGRHLPAENMGIYCVSRIFR